MVFRSQHPATCESQGTHPRFWHTSRFSPWVRQSNKSLVASRRMWDVKGEVTSSKTEEPDKRPKPQTQRQRQTQTQIQILVLYVFQIQTGPRAATSALNVLLALFPFHFCWAPKLSSLCHTHFDFQTSQNPEILGSAMTKWANKRLGRRQTGWTDV